MNTCAALFVRPRSIYHALPGVDCWDEARDARNYSGNLPVIAHPPCRGWGKLAHLAKVHPGELELAYFALAAVRRCGGVLEHPVGSRLWREADLPRPGEFPDPFGGRTELVRQCDWGHRAEKATLLYIVGAEVPPYPARRVPTAHVENMWRGEREATPPEFASWLVQLANSVHICPCSPMRLVTPNV